jgi:hypothetical protein
LVNQQHAALKASFVQSVKQGLAPFGCCNDSYLSRLFTSFNGEIPKGAQQVFTGVTRFGYKNIATSSCQQSPFSGRADRGYDTTIQNLFRHLRQAVANCPGTGKNQQTGQTKWITGQKLRNFFVRHRQWAEFMSRQNDGLQAGRWYISPDQCRQGFSLGLWPGDQ